MNFACNSTTSCPSARILRAHHLIDVGDIANSQTHKVAATQFAADREVEQGKIADRVSILEVNADSPNVFGSERRLLADQLNRRLDTSPVCASTQYIWKICFATSSPYASHGRFSLTACLCSCSTLHGVRSCFTFSNVRNRADCCSPRIANASRLSSGFTFCLGGDDTRTGARRRCHPVRPSR